MSLEKERTVAVIGGLGRMGVVTGRIFEAAGYTPLISDIRDPKTLPAREAIRQSGIVFFSVLPIEEIGKIVLATADTFDNNHIVMDNATVKSPITNALKILDGINVSICSTHPLCKEDQPLFGQNVLIAPFGKNSERATIIAENVYGKAGMVLVRVDFEQHDSLMLLNQLLPHLVNRSIGLVLANNGADVKALDRISTPNSRLLYLAAWRTLVQPSEISAAIIRNLLKQPEGRKMVRDLLDAIARVTREDGEEGKLEDTFRDTVTLLDPTGQISVEMNRKTITILERLANLRHHSATIEAKGDRPGLLRTMLEPLADAGININAIDSHRTKDGTLFELGIESGEMTPEVIKRLENLGFSVTTITVSPRES